jgi:hypothetical protein
MKLNELQDKLDEDLKIDPSKLIEETANNLGKHAWWLRQFTAERAKLKQANSEMLALLKDRYNFYSGYSDTPYDYNLDSKAVKYNLEGDSKVLEKQKQLNMIQVRMEFIEKACDLMVSRGFAIKNQIELLKFNNGIS